MARRTALITGANRGIGLEVCRQLAERGTHVLLTGRDAIAVADAVKPLVGSGLDVQGEVLDVASEESVKDCARRVDARSAGLGGPAAYAMSKAALNALTVRLAAEASGDVKVNAATPGWVRTRMGGSGAPRSVEEGADTIVWLATLPADGPSGGLFRDRQRFGW